MFSVRVVLCSVLRKNGFRTNLKQLAGKEYSIGCKMVKMFVQRDLRAIDNIILSVSQFDEGNLIRVGNIDMAGF